MTELKGAIIVGYDGSVCADTALDWAVEEARLRQVTLTIFHSWNSRTAELLHHASCPVAVVRS